MGQEPYRSECPQFAQASAAVGFVVEQVDHGFGQFQRGSQLLPGPSFQ